MQVKDIFVEICNRVGEGYQNYLDRAAAHFKTAITSSLYQSSRPDLDAPFLCRVGRFNPTEVKDIYRIKLYTLLSMAGLSEGKIRLLKYCPDKTAMAAIDSNNPNTTIIFYAKEPGENGNNIAIKYTDPWTDGELEIVAPIVNGKPVITIRLTVVSETVTTTVDELLAALPKSDAWRYVSAKAAEDASGESRLNVDAGKTDGGEGDGYFYPMETITDMQREILSLNPMLASIAKNKVIYYSLSGHGNDVYINIVPSTWFKADGTIEFALVGWDSDVFKKDSEVDNVEAMFHPAFLDVNITAAAEMLRAEIQA